MRSLLPSLPSLWVLGLASVNTLILQSSHAQILPGLDEEERPQNQNDIDEFSQCIDSTLNIYNQGIGNELSLVLAQSLPDLSECEPKNNEVVCNVDMEDYHNNVETLCSAVSGQYNERYHQVQCQSANSALLNYIVKNYPSCFSSDCEPADLERAINQEVELLERVFSELLSLPCTVDYEIEDPNKPNPVINTCRYQENATPQICGPLEKNTQKLVCDCYSFCDGQLVGCDNAEQVSCDGELVEGCTLELFGLYNVQKSSSPIIQTVTSVLVSLPLVAWLALL